MKIDKIVIPLLEIEEVFNKKQVCKITKIESLNKESTYGDIPRYGIFQKPPKIGNCFILLPISYSKQQFRGIITSNVTKIIDENTFATKNSIYKYETTNNTNT